MSSTELSYTVGPLMRSISDVEQLRALSVGELTELCDEIRDYLIDVMADRGGYLGSNLGVIELTAALHYVYHTPKDRLVWDAGHQLLPHLLLTGRRHQLEGESIIPYQLPGSGQPQDRLHPLDVWQPGHASRSISAALGLATGSQLQGQDSQTVAIIGDASIAAGLAFEAMNHAGGLNRDLLIILNDNNRSIDPNVGALNEYLAEITSSQTFNKMRDEIYDLLGHFRSAGHKMRKAAARLEKAVMAAVTPGSLFDALGLKYYGPIDGHNPQTLVRHLTDMRNVSGAKLLHVVTVKGKGFAPAVRDPKQWKGRVKPFDRISGKPLEPVEPEPELGKRRVQAPLYSKLMADVLTELAAEHDDIVGVTPSVFDEAGLQHFREAYPDRAFRVGLSEDHAATFAAGLARSGRYPVLSMQASLLPRALDAIVQDWAQHGINGIISLEEAGVAHKKGAAYHSLYDLSMLRTLPDVTIASPADAEELNAMVRSAYHHKGIWVIRGSYSLPKVTPQRQSQSLIEPGALRVLREGESVLIFSLGETLALAAMAADQLQEDEIYAGHVDARFVAPLNRKRLTQLADHYDHWVSIEEGMRTGGFGSALGDWLHDQPEHQVRLHRYGFEEPIAEAGTQAKLWTKYGFEASELADWIRARIQR
jgi:1-deoxy-D-xylulose-5-phosphate synthase